MAKADPMKPSSVGEKRAIFLGLREVLQRELTTGRSMRAVYVASGAAKPCPDPLFARYFGPLICQGHQRSKARDRSPIGQHLNRAADHQSTRSGIRSGRAP